MTTITEETALEDFDAYLDEYYPRYQLGVCTFYPSQIMKELDPIAYQVEFNDWCDAHGVEVA